jgi:hypothetical protein
VLDSVFQAFERLVTQFSWRRLTFWILFFIVVVTGFWSYERYTAQFRLRKLEHATALLERLELLRRQPNALQDTTLASAFREIRDQLDTVLRQTSLMPAVSPTVWKGIAGAAPWLLLALAFVPSVRRGESDTAAAIAGVLILAVVFGVLGIVLPTALGPNLLYIVYPLGSFFFIMLIALVWQGARNRALGGPQAAVATLKSDLRSIVIAEEMYFADHVEYSDKVAALNFTPSPGVTIRQITKTGDGFVVVASHQHVSIAYGIRVGSGGPFEDMKEGAPFPIPSKRSAKSHH